MSISESRVLQLALERLESQKRELDVEIAELRGRQDNSRVNQRGRPRKQASHESKPPNIENGSSTKKRMSEAHRRAISQAMKERWARRNNDASTVNKGGAADVDKTKPRLIKAKRPVEQP